MGLERTWITSLQKAEELNNKANGFKIRLISEYISTGNGFRNASVYQPSLSQRYSFRTLCYVAFTLESIFFNVLNAFLKAKRLKGSQILHKTPMMGCGVVAFLAIWVIGSFSSVCVSALTPNAVDRIISMVRLWSQLWDKIYSGLITLTLEVTSADTVLYLEREKGKKNDEGSFNWTVNAER